MLFYRHTDFWALGYLVKRHFDTLTREAGDQTSDLPINGRPALPLKLSLTYHLCRSDSATG